MKFAVYYGFKEHANNGGPKMVWDMLATVRGMGYQPFCLYEVTGVHISVQGLLQGLRNTLRLAFLLKKGDHVLLQFPLNRTLMKYVYRVIRWKKAHSITMIHDVDYLRNIPLRNKGVDGMKKAEIRLLNLSEYIIAPNQKMIEKLTEDGVRSAFVPQMISDYMQDGGEEITPDRGQSDPAVIIAGNLGRKKAGYIYQMRPETYTVNLYGQGLEELEGARMRYCGAFSPNELIKNMCGDYGLVWDGPSCEGCLGDYGTYQKYNNPHKTSLYIAASIPVIIWKHAALSAFVEENKIGFSVATLDEINERIRNQDYHLFKENIKAISGRIRTGQYLNDALRKIEAMIQS